MARDDCMSTLVLKGKGDIFPHSGSCRCALTGVPCRLGMLSIFSTSDNMLRLTISPARANPRRARLQPPDASVGTSGRWRIHQPELIIIIIIILIIVVVVIIMIIINN